MRTFKKIDLALQLAIIFIFSLLLLFTQTLYVLFPYLYIILPLQGLSFVIHLLCKWHRMKGSRRYNFKIAACTIILLTGINAFIKMPHIIAATTAIAVLFLPVYYVWVCFMEVFYYEKRPLELI